MPRFSSCRNLCLVFERYYHELHLLIARSVGCRDKAQDVVQEACMRVLASPHYKALSQGQAGSGLGALLYTTAKNIVIDQYRQDQTRRCEDIEHAALPASRADEPEPQVAGRQALQQLMVLIEALPPRCKEAFVLYKFEGLSHARIAEQMGISVNMVEKHIIHGMVACKKGMAARGAE